MFIKHKCPHLPFVELYLLNLETLTSYDVFEFIPSKLIFFRIVRQNYLKFSGWQILLHIFILRHSRFIFGLKNAPPPKNVHMQGVFQVIIRNLYTKCQKLSNPFFPCELYTKRFTDIYNTEINILQIIRLI